MTMTLEVEPQVVESNEVTSNPVQIEFDSRSLDVIAKDFLAQLEGRDDIEALSEQSIRDHLKSLETSEEFDRANQSIEDTLLELEKLDIRPPATSHSEIKAYLADLEAEMSEEP